MFDDLQKQQPNDNKQLENSKEKITPLEPAKIDINQKIKNLRELGVKQGRKKKIYSVIGIIFILFCATGVVAAAYYYWPEINGAKKIKDINKGAEKKIPCTLEAKICPDGSSVGRIPPDCEFAECPAVDEEKEIDIDSDLDGLTNIQEETFGTNPNNSDSDGDGYLDGDEVKSGYNPNGEGKLNLSINPEQKIKIVQPVDGEIFNSGDELTVLVEVQDSLNLDTLIIASQFEQTFLNVEPFTQSLIIPSDFGGEAQIGALVKTLDDEWLIDEVTIKVMVPTTLVLNSLECSPTSFFFGRPRGQEGITVTAVFSDGIERDVSGPGNETEFVSSDPTIVEVSSLGVVKAVSEGTSIITVKYREKVCKIPVTISFDDPELLGL